MAESSSEDEDTTQHPSPSYASVAGTTPLNSQMDWQLAGYSKELLDRILNSIAESPGLTAEISKKALKAFQWRIEEGNYIVALPRNLSDYQTNPIVQTAVASIKMLKAQIVESCPATVSEIEFLAPMAEYIRGLGAALKIAGSGRMLVPDPFSGLFHQGYRWAASEAMYAQHFPSRAFRLNYKAPVDCFPAKLFSAEDPNSAMYQSWCTLVKEASKRIKLAEPRKWAKNSQEIIQDHCKKAFQYESRAIFSADEVKSMTIYASSERERYNAFLTALKNPTDEFILKFDDNYSSAIKSLQKYDNTLGRIANIRASILFQGPKKPEKGKRVALTREDRVQLLDLYNWIIITNPTGLFGDERVEFQVKVRRGTPDEEESYGQWADWVMKLPRTTYLANPLLFNWCAEVVSRANTLLEPEKPFENPMVIAMANGRMDDELVQWGRSALERISLASCNP